jgi:hypothetical protein
MRNAVSLFEQLIVDSQISYQHIVETLGVASEDEKNQFISKLLSKDVSLLDDFQVLKSSGKNLKNFFKEILADIQNSAIASLKLGQNILSSVTIMQELQDMLMKSKNSFDESMTFSIGLIKMLAGEEVIIKQLSKQTPLPNPLLPGEGTKKQVQKNESHLSSQERIERGVDDK